MPYLRIQPKRSLLGRKQPPAAGDPSVVAPKHRRGRLVLVAFHPHFSASEVAEGKGHHISPKEVVTIGMHLRGHIPLQDEGTPRSGLSLPHKGVHILDETRRSRTGFCQADPVPVSVDPSRHILDAETIILLYIAMSLSRPKRESFDNFKEVLVLELLLVELPLG